MTGAGVVGAAGVLVTGGVGAVVGFSCWRLGAGNVLGVGALILLAAGGSGAGGITTVSGIGETASGTNGDRLGFTCADAVETIVKQQPTAIATSQLFAMSKTDL